MTTVFPSSTAPAVTTFATGLAPKQHGITAWYMHIKEFGAVSAVLPMRLWAGPVLGIPGARAYVFDLPEIYTMRTHIVTEDSIAPNYGGKNMTVHSYRKMSGFFSGCRAAMNAPGRKFIYAYWPWLDRIGHLHGPHSKEARQHLAVFDAEFAKLMKKIYKYTGVTIPQRHPSK